MLKTFKKAFSSQITAFRQECNCGLEYYHNDHLAWDFDDSEIEGLKQSGAIELETSVDIMYIDNREYVSECDCWHPKAELIMDFLNRHNTEIAKYINGERARKMLEAEHMSLIDILSDTTLGKNDFDEIKPF